MAETWPERQERERREYAEWVESLKTGDDVVVRYPGFSPDTTATVDRVTKTQIVVSGGRKYRRKGCPGRRVGDHYGPWLVRPTPENREAIAARELFQQVWLRVDKSKPESLASDDWRAILAILEKGADDA